jgi:Holliday junction resolvase RusA-like endonuclease
MPKLTLNLPLPPSVNQAYGNRRGNKGRGRYKTSAFKAWLRNADAHYTMQSLGLRGRIYGPYHVTFYMPESIRADEDNLIKPVLDWMVSRQLTSDDRHMRGHEVKRCPEVPPNMLWIVVREHER